jgi:enoyl-CoA hydratase/carnithine racemase
MSTVLYEQAGRIVTITMNRPDAMNAVDPETHEALIAAWTRFRDDDAAWVAILTGAGEKSFSAGADLKKMIPASFAKGAARPGHEGYGLGDITRAARSGSP